jgi:hypothetical protein
MAAVIVAWGLGDNCLSLKFKAEGGQAGLVEAVLMADDI